MKSTSYAALYALPFLVAFGLSVLMLQSDTNLRTDFGTVTSGYYLHWYVVLVAAVADLVGAALLLVLRSRLGIKLGVLGSGLLALIFVGDIFTYRQVGFSSASSFADYLFGITYYGGDIRYLYDALLAVYVVTFLVGLVLVYLTRPSRPPAPVAPAAAAPTPPSSSP